MTVKVGSVGYQADYVVVAVPLRALNKIAMTPALDAQHLGAIKGTNYGWRDQIMLKFKTPVWESKARMSGEIYSNTGLGMLWVEPALKGGANVVDQPVRRQRAGDAGFRRQADGRSGADSSARVLSTGARCVHRL